MENIDELARQYRYKKMGYIATGYVKEQEEAVYMAASKILANKYPDLIDANEAYNVLNSKGNIFTVCKYDGDRRNGVFEPKTGNILIPYLIRRMTENLLHEITHKEGFLKSDETFFQMNPDIRENGTEIVASESLSIKKTKKAVLPYVWGAYPEKASSELITYSLIKQLNLLAGGQTLEKTILQGHDYFKEKIEQRYGKEFYEYVSLTITSISQNKNKLYGLLKELGAENKNFLSLANEFWKEIRLFEDTIVKKEFDLRMDSVNSLETGKSFLEELNEFGINRFQRYNNEGVLEDNELKNIFNDYKQQIEEEYGETGIEFVKADIENLPNIEFEEEIDEEELNTIEQMAIEFEKTSRKRLKEAKRNKFIKFFKKILGNYDEDKTKKLPKGTTEDSFYNSIKVEDYTSPIANDNAQKDQTRKKERERTD